MLEPYAIRGRRVKRGERVGVKSVDQALQLREHMALRNVIRLVGHRVHMIWGEAVDVLTRDERGAKPTSGRRRLLIRGVEGIAGE